MILSVTSKRLLELSALLSRWASFTVVPKAQLQSLVGKLIFVSKCVTQEPPVFILAILRSISDGDSCSKVRLSMDFHRDFTNGGEFLPFYNRVSYLYYALKLMTMVIASKL